MLNNKGKVSFSCKLKVPKSALYLTNNYLLALSRQGNYLYDISDKTSPYLISKFAFTIDNNENSLLGFIDNKAYFRVGYANVEIIDFHEKAHPVNMGLIRNITIGPRCEFYAGRYLITNTRTLVIYDVAAPLNPKTIYEFEEQIIDFLQLKTYMICATLNSGIKIYDITDPSRPRLASVLHINAVKLVAKNHEIFVAQGLNDMLHVIDIGNIQNIRVTANIEMPGPIASDSLISASDYIFVRYMRKFIGDTTEAFNISNCMAPKKIFTHKCINAPAYIANDKIIVLIGIKNWDGVSPIQNYNTNIYQFFSIMPNKVRHIADIELDAIYFSSIVLKDTVVYLSRPDEICVYELKGE